MGLFWDMVRCIIASKEGDFQKIIISSTEKLTEKVNKTGKCNKLRRRSNVCSDLTVYIPAGSEADRYCGKKVERKKAVAEKEFTIDNGTLIKYNGEGGDVIIPDGVTSIGEMAFWDIRRLIQIPPGGFNSVKNIEQYTLWGGSMLTSVTIPNSVTSIGNRAFHACRGLTLVSIPEGVTSIGEGAFSYCLDLSSVTIPNSVTSIGNRAFWGCIGLTSLTIPDRITSIEEGAFQWCTSLNSVNIPNSVTNIGNDAFWGCDSLIYITIPNGVTRIGDGAFESCTSLTSVTIPDNVTRIGKVALKNCPKLTVHTPAGSKAGKYFKKNKIIVENDV